MDAQIIAWLAEISAINAEVEAMKAENKQREVEGLSVAHTQANFAYAAQQLNDIATAAKFRTAMGC